MDMAYLAVVFVFGEFKKYYLNISKHGNIDFSIHVVPLKGDSEI